MKTSELTGALLALWVARAEGIEEKRGIKLYASGPCLYKETQWGGGEPFPYRPDCDWEHGGPIIEREKLYLRDPDPMARHVDSSLDNKWEAAKANHATRMYEHHQYGKTALLAAMRCYVASKFGEEVPDTEPA